MLKTDPISAMVALPVPVALWFSFAAPLLCAKTAACYWGNAVGGVIFCHPSPFKESRNASRARLVSSSK